MRSPTRTFTAAALALLFLGESKATQVLTWKQTLDETAGNNSELRAARESLQASHYAKNGSYSTYLPSVAGTLTYDYRKNPDTPVNDFLSTAGVDNPNPVRTYDVGITVNQNLFAGLRDKALVDQAAANENISKANLSLVKARISYELKASYAGLLFAQRNTKLQQQIIERRKDNLALVQLRFQNGRENRGSVLLSKANLNLAHYNSLQADHNLQVAQADLARTLGRDEDADVAVKEDIPREEPPARASIRVLAMQTPDHEQVVAQEDFAEAGVTLARSGFFPTLGLSGFKGREDNKWFPDHDTWSINAQLTIPLFSGGRDYFGTKSAIANYSSSKSTRQNVDRQLFTKLRRTYNSYTEAIEKLKVDESYLEAASKRSEIARGKYNNGLMTFEDWDLIENDLISRETGVLQSQRDLSVTEAAWQQAQGKGDLP